MRRRGRGKCGHGRSRPEGPPIVNNIQKTVDDVFACRLDFPSPAAPNCHRTGIGFARGAALTPFDRSSNRSREMCMNRGILKALLGAALVSAAFGAFAQKTQLTVYTALETDQLKAYE